MRSVTKEASQLHPNSGFPIIDHGTNPLWIKQILPLDLSQLDPYDPPMEATEA